MVGREGGRKGRGREEGGREESEKGGRGEMREGLICNVCDLHNLNVN